MSKQSARAISASIAVAVAVVVRDTAKGKAVLLVRRAVRESDALDWVFPGGKIEAGETPNRAAQRELLEEAGVLAKYPKPIGRRIHPKTGVNIFYVAFRQSVASKTAPTDEKITESAWIDIEKIEHYFGGEIFGGVRAFLRLDEPKLHLSTSV